MVQCCWAGTAEGCHQAVTYSSRRTRVPEGCLYSGIPLGRQACQATFVSIESGPVNGRSLEAKRLRVVIATVVINVTAVSLLTLAPWSDWRTGVGLNLLDNALLIGFAIWHRDGFMFRLLLFGLVTGLAELPADAWLVDHTRTLDYSVGGGPILWRSPIWMPLAWEVVAVQFGYLGLRLMERFGTVAGLAGIGILGAINIPFYEQMARTIHWWTYQGCRMISATPYYIILGELGIAMALAWLARGLRAGKTSRALFLGLAAGAAIFLCYLCAFTVTDGLCGLLR